jgi:hypothetical protein
MCDKGEGRAADNLMEAMNAFKEFRAGMLRWADDIGERFKAAAFVVAKMRAGAVLARVNDDLSAAGLSNGRLLSMQLDGGAWVIELSEEDTGGKPRSWARVIGSARLTGADLATIAIELLAAKVISEIFGGVSYGEINGGETSRELPRRSPEGGSNGSRSDVAHIRASVGPAQ